MLSEIAQIYDPLGLAAPVVPRAKMFIQKLWALNLDWNETLSDEITQQWIDFRNEFINHPKITVSRCMLSLSFAPFALHGFSDASNHGYDAIIYVVTAEYTRFVCAKSRVAPLKPMTTPRLELCAAVLLANLMHKVCGSMRQSVNEIKLWSDSEITIYRIKSQANRYQSFVGTRIAEIQELSFSSNWRYVPSQLNPADLMSRGLSP